MSVLPLDDPPRMWGRLESNQQCLGLKSAVRTPQSPAKSVAVRAVRTTKNRIESGRRSLLFRWSSNPRNGVEGRFSLPLGAEATSQFLDPEPPVGIEPTLPQYESGTPPSEFQGRVRRDRIGSRQVGGRLVSWVFEAQKRPEPFLLIMELKRPRSFSIQWEAEESNPQVSDRWFTANRTSQRRASLPVCRVDTCLGGRRVSRTPCPSSRHALGSKEAPRRRKFVFHCLIMFPCRFAEVGGFEPQPLCGRTVFETGPAPYASSPSNAHQRGPGHVGATFDGDAPGATRFCSFKSR